MKVVGVSVIDALFEKRPDRKAEGELSHRTVKNMLAGKGAPKPSTVDKFFELAALKSDFGASLRPMVKQSFQTYPDSFGGPWYCFCGGAVASTSVPTLEIREIKRLVDVSYELKPHLVDRNPKGLAQAINALDLPMTGVTRRAVSRLETVNDNSLEAMGRVLGVLSLSNLLYLLVCYYQGSDLVDRLVPSFADNECQFPIARWLEGMRAISGFSNDEQFGAAFFPGWKPENAAREIKRWRNGKIPSWKTIRGVARSARTRGFPEERVNDLYTEYATIKLLHGLNDCAAEMEALGGGFSREAYFESLPELRRYAEARARLDTIGDADSDSKAG